MSQKTFLGNQEKHNFKILHKNLHMKVETSLKRLFNFSKSCDVHLKNIKSYIFCFYFQLNGFSFYLIYDFFIVK